MGFLWRASVEGWRGVRAISLEGYLSLLLTTKSTFPVAVLSLLL